MHTSRVLVLVGAILLLISGFLPWATVSSGFLGLSRSLSGMESDGVIAMLIGGLALLIALLAKGKPGSPYSGFAVLLGLLAGGITCYVMFKVLTLVTGASAGTSTDLGIGGFCSVLGAFLVLIGGAKSVPADPPLPAPPVA